MITHYFCGGEQKPHTVQTNTKLLTFLLEKVYTDDYISLSQIVGTRRARREGVSTTNERPLRVHKLPYYRTTADGLHHRTGPQSGDKLIRYRFRARAWSTTRFWCNLEILSDSFSNIKYQRGYHYKFCSFIDTSTKISISFIKR